LKVKVALVGAGKWGKKIADTLPKLRNCELVAVCDKDEGKAKVARSHEVPFFRDVQAMLRKVDSSAVIIATSTSSHYEVAMQTINAGKHSFVEKPICVRSEEAAELVRIATERQVKLMVGHIERFNPAVRKLKELIEKGVIGDVLSASARRLGGYASDVGAVEDLATHDIDVMRYLIGEPSSVFAVCHFREDQIEDHVCMLLTFDEGATGYVEASQLAQVKERSLLVVGDSAVAKLDYVKATLTVRDSEGERSLTVAREEPLKLELQHFVDCVARDEDPLVTGLDGLRVLEVTEAALRSARSGRPEVIRR
jgi:UDP-N-acetylglucosamine 3-dehydrogenase